MIGRLGRTLKSNLSASDSFIYDQSADGIRETFKNMQGGREAGQAISSQLKTFSIKNDETREKAIADQVTRLNKKSDGLREKGGERNMGMADAYERQAQDFQKASNLSYDDLKSSRDGLKDMQKDLDDKMWESAKGTPGKAKDWMIAKDRAHQDDRFKTAAMRSGLAVGGYVGINAAGRAATGGGMTYNNRGERDIAGVPFV